MDLVQKLAKSWVTCWRCQREEFVFRFSLQLVMRHFCSMSVDNFSLSQFSFFLFLQKSANESKKKFPYSDECDPNLSKKRRKLTWEDWWEGGVVGALRLWVIQTLMDTNTDSLPKCLITQSVAWIFLTRSKTPHSLFAKEKRKRANASLKPAGWRSVTSPTRNQAVCIQSPSTLFFFFASAKSGPG